jgi:hypothetical protein
VALFEPVTLLQMCFAGSSVKPAGTVFGAAGNRARQEPAEGASLVQSKPVHSVALLQAAAQARKEQS